MFEGYEKSHGLDPTAISENLLHLVSLRPCEVSLNSGLVYFKLK